MSAPPQARLDRRRYIAGPGWRTFQLTAHFHLGEFIRDQAAAPGWETMNMCRGFALSVLEPLRDRFGPCVIVSGHRTPARNREVGGASNSWHVWEWHPGELGLDVIFQRGNPALWAAAAADTRAGGIGRYARHVHLDSRPGRVVWASAAP